MQNHCHRLIALASATILCMLVWGCPTNRSPTGDQSVAAKEQTMKTDQTAALWQPEIPPIDAAAPAHFDTATFGLG